MGQYGGGRCMLFINSNQPQPFISKGRKTAMGRKIYFVIL